MKEKDRIGLWLALYEEGDIIDGECYIENIPLMHLIERFGVPREERETEILMLLAWGLIEKSDSSAFSPTYRRNKSWKPSLGMLFLDRMEARQPIGEGRLQGGN